MFVCLILLGGSHMPLCPSVSIVFCLFCKTRKLNQAYLQNYYNTSGYTTDLTMLYDIVQDLDKYSDTETIEQ